MTIDTCTFAIFPFATGNNLFGKDKFEIAIVILLVNSDKRKCFPHPKYNAYAFVFISCIFQTKTLFSM